MMSSTARLLSRQKLMNFWRNERGMKYNFHKIKPQR